MNGETKRFGVSESYHSSQRTEWLLYGMKIVVLRAHPTIRLSVSKTTKEVHLTLGMWMSTRRLQVRISISFRNNRSPIYHSFYTWHFAALYEERHVKAEILAGRIFVKRVPSTWKEAMSGALSSNEDAAPRQCPSSEEQHRISTLCHLEQSASVLKKLLSNTTQWILTNLKKHNDIR